MLYLVFDIIVKVEGVVIEGYIEVVFIGVFNDDFKQFWLFGYIQGWVFYFVIEQSIQWEFNICIEVWLFQQDKLGVGRGVVLFVGSILDLFQYCFVVVGIGKVGEVVEVRQGNIV